MILQNIDFGCVWGASGVQGFFGEGYWWHRYLRLFGLDFKGMSFVSKTATLKPRAGNLVLTSEHTPKHYFPDCIVIKPIQGIVLNAVGLSNPGIEALLKQDAWQKRIEPFQISFMPITDSLHEQLAEIDLFTEILSKCKFRAPYGVQLNISCPNVAHNFSDIKALLIALSTLACPIIIKVDPLFPTNVCSELQQYFDAICVGNTLPYGKFPDEINWNKLFGTQSPLAKYGGGALSGKPLLPLVLSWIRNARSSGIYRSINACGGILSPKDVYRTYLAGADAISLGSIAMLRPWRVKKTIAFAHETFRK